MLALIDPIPFTLLVPLGVSIGTHGPLFFSYQYVEGMVICYDKSRSWAWAS